MGASRCVLLHALKVRSGEVHRLFRVVSSYSLGLGSGGGVSPNKPKAFVYQMVIFTTEAALDAIGGGSGRAI